MDGRSFPVRIKSLNNEIKRLLDRSAISKNDANLTGVQYGMMGYLHDCLARGQDAFQRDIEAEFNIRRSTATGLLQTLEREGYILRVPVPEDARLKRIVMTEKALELEKIARENIMQLEERLLRDIPEEEMERFYKTLEKITKNVQE